MMFFNASINVSLSAIDFGVSSKLGHTKLTQIHIKLPFFVISMEVEPLELHTVFTCHFLIKYFPLFLKFCGDFWSFPKSHSLRFFTLKSWYHHISVNIVRIDWQFFEYSQILILKKCKIKIEKVLVIPCWSRFCNCFFGNFFSTAD